MPKDDFTKHRKRSLEKQADLGIALSKRDFGLAGKHTPISRCVDHVSQRKPRRIVGRLAMMVKMGPEARLKGWAVHDAKTGIVRLFKVC